METAAEHKHELCRRLNEAIKDKNLEEVHVVLDELKKQNIKPNGKDSEGRTALHHAASLDFWNGAALILEYGANPNLSDNEGNTALHTSAADDYEKVIEVLLQHGARSDLENNDGETPLHVAAYINNNNEETVKLLLKNDATKIDSKGRCGSTAICLAVMENNNPADAIKVLLEYGADPNQITDEGQSLIHIAIEHDDGKVINEQEESEAQSAIEVIKALLTYGAKIDLKDKEGKTPLDIACKARKYNAISILTQASLELQSIENRKILEGQNHTFQLLYETNQDKLANILRDQAILSQLEATDFTKEFPLYGAYLANNLKRGITRKEALQPSLNYMLRTRNQPFYREVLSHISNDELLKLATAVEQQEQQLQLSSTSGMGFFPTAPSVSENQLDAHMQHFSSFQS